MNLDDTTILLTGGTGSFGQAFIQRVLKEHSNVTIRVFSRDELKQSELPPDSRLRYLLGDVRDRQRLHRAMVGCDVVIHAAAMKQVPACEYNPFEAVQTNIIGTQNVVDVAIDSGVKLVVGLSTDKAVNPVNLYGATKLCAEKIIVQGNAYSAATDTKLACVRYGNVVGSRGSVVSMFRNHDGVIRLTDERMTRFWLSLDGAVDLVMLAVDRAVGGEIFIPKLPSMRLVDVADVLAPGVPREIIGIRPGEKLHEMLITEEEARHTVDVGDCYVVLPEHAWWTNNPKWFGVKLPDGFRYSSETNDRWVLPDDLLGV